MSTETIIKKAVKSLYDKPSLSANSKEIKQVIKSIGNKVTRINKAYNLQIINYADAIKNNPAQLVDFWESDNNFKLLVKREQTFFFETQTARHENSYWDSKGKNIPVIRFKRKIYFKHPVLLDKKTKRNNKWQHTVNVWARPSSCTRTQNKHLHTSRKKKGVSQFNKTASVKIEKIDLDAFHNGAGIVRTGSEDKMYIFVCYDTPIGISDNQLTKYLRADVQRIKRNGRPFKQDGYKTEIHSYPISRDKIVKEFPKVQKGLLKHLKTNIRKIP